MNKDEIIKYLSLLGQRLKEKGEEGEIILTGGAAMSLVHSARDMTKDVDSIYEPKTSINEIVKQIADEYSLEPGWLNDSVKGFVGENAPAEKYLKMDGLTINTVSPDYLLSMKLLSARYSTTDYEDINFLIKKMDIKNVEQVYDTLKKYWPEKMIMPKTMYILEEFFDNK